MDIYGFVCICAVCLKKVSMEVCQYLYVCVCIQEREERKCVEEWTEERESIVVLV